MYCLWPLPHILLVCTTLVCVLFVATTMYTISVYYFSMCVYPRRSLFYYYMLYLCLHYYYLAGLLGHRKVVYINIHQIYIKYIFWAPFILAVPIGYSYLDCVEQPRGEGSPWTTACHWSFAHRFC